jgi:tetratricopeptide (TPR) repeat protein
MEPKQIKDIPNNIFTLYQKGAQSFKLNNIEYAIELMKTAVIKEPGFIEARKELRKMEMSKPKQGLLNKALKGFKINKTIKMAQMKMAMKKYQEAYVYIEEALAINIHSATTLKLLAEVGRATESNFITVEAFDLAVMLFPENLEILKLAAVAYRESNLGKKEVDVRKKIVSLKPDDLKARMEMREASALATMEKSDWENKDKSYRDKLKSQEESATLEANEKIAKEEDDVLALINHYKDELKENSESVKALRELGNIYMNVGKYDDAVEMFEKLVKVKSTFDITVDLNIEKAKIGKIQKEIEELNKEKQLSPSMEEAFTSKINDANTRISIIKKEYAVNRVEKFPNDMQLRFTLAKVYWDEKNYDDAIEQFQLSQSNLNRQIPSLIFLGRCFMEKLQFDIATDQFLKVLNEARTSAGQQFEALYYLGLSYEQLDKKEEAGVCFKKIYSAKSTYKDIAEIIKRYY